jgi:hypothetical protein
MMKVNTSASTSKQKQQNPVMLTMASPSLQQHHHYQQQDNHHDQQNNCYRYNHNHRNRIGSGLGIGISGGSLLSHVLLQVSRRRFLLFVLWMTSLVVMTIIKHNSTATTTSNTEHLMRHPYHDYPDHDDDDTTGDSTSSRSEEGQPRFSFGIFLGSLISSSSPIKTTQPERQPQLPLPFSWDEIPLHDKDAKGNCGVDKCFFTSTTTDGVGYLLATQTTSEEGSMIDNLQRAYNFSRAVLEDTCHAQHLYLSEPFLVRADRSILQRLNDMSRNEYVKYMGALRRAQKQQKGPINVDQDNQVKESFSSRRGMTTAPAPATRSTHHQKHHRNRHQNAERLLRRRPVHPKRSRDRRRDGDADAKQLLHQEGKPNRLVFPMYYDDDDDEDIATRFAGRYNPEYEWIVVQPVKVAPSPALSFGVIGPKFDQLVLEQIPQFRHQVRVSTEVLEGRLTRAQAGIRCAMQHSPTKRYWYDFQGLIDVDGNFFHTDVDSQFWNMMGSSNSDDHRDDHDTYKKEQSVLRMFNEMIQRIVYPPPIPPSLPLPVSEKNGMKMMTPITIELPVDWWNDDEDDDDNDGDGDSSDGETDDDSHE